MYIYIYKQYFIHRKYSYKYTYIYVVYWLVWIINCTRWTVRTLKRLVSC